MPSMKTVKRRLLSVTTTQKIMKAMNMVAASKLQKNKARLLSVRPFLSAAEIIKDNIWNSEASSKNIYMQQRKINNTAYIIITSDRGLCGSFNTNLSSAALEHMKSKNEKLIIAGLKGHDYFSGKNKKIVKRFDDVLETAFFEDAEKISEYILSLYSSGEADEVFIAYTKFESALVNNPRIEQILPLAGNNEKTDKAYNMEYIPDINSFASYAIPMYITSFIYTALLESAACEQAARMISMDTAATNASEIINKLQHIYNRGRQTLITQEINELINSINIE